METDKTQLDRLEQRLRAHDGAVLSGSFKRNVMDAVALLPEPQYIAPVSAQRGWLDLLRLLTTGEKVMVGAVVAVLASLFIPGALDWIDSVGFSLSSAVVAFSFGGTVLSASMLSIVAFGVCGSLLAAAGAYGSRHRLIGA